MNSIQSMGKHEAEIQIDVLIFTNTFSESEK